MTGLGIAAGFSVLVLVGYADLPTPDSSAYWPKEIVSIIAIPLLGLIFFCASLVALRSRRHAGWIFLLSAPVAGFCLAYPDAGFLEWRPDGGGYFLSPFLLTGLGIAVLFFLPFLVALLAIRNRRRALVLFLISAAAVAPVFVYSRWTVSLLPELAAWSALFVIFGWFWLGTSKRGWPPMVAARPRPLGRRLATVVLGLLLLMVSDMVATFALAAAMSTTKELDCGMRRLFAQPVAPEHTVFTARVIRAQHVRQVSGKWIGEWAIGVVQRRFWGLPALIFSLCASDELLFLGGRNLFH